MEGQFQVDRGSCATTPEGYDATPAIEPSRRGQTWQFVDEFQRLLGEDSEPDIRFFVDSWTAGTAQAVKSFQQRQQRQPERPRRASYELNSVDTLSFVQERALHEEFVSSITAPAVATYSNATSQPESLEDTTSQTEEQAWQEWEKFTKECGASSIAIHPKAQQYALLLLGVNSTSTRKQIKAAYRKMVSEWHPDRLKIATEKSRRLANERMAAINEAYHLLISNQR